MSDSIDVLGDTYQCGGNMKENLVLQECSSVYMLSKNRSAKSSEQNVTIREENGETVSNACTLSMTAGRHKRKREEDEDASSLYKDHSQHSSTSSVEFDSSLDYLHSDTSGNAAKRIRTDNVQNNSLVSRQTEFEMLELLGAGTYGRVYKCLDIKKQEEVAAKICDKAAFMKEITIWNKINSSISHEVPIIRLLDSLEYDMKGCLVFELLDKSLQELIYEAIIPMEGIARILKDVLAGFVKLKEIGIIHGDIKPDNIMLINHGTQPYRVKIIDFGLAIRKETDHHREGIQSLYYRAPEVMLGLPYNEAIDMWSIGCLLGALLTRRHIYPGSCEYDTLRLIMETHGLPPWHMMTSNMKALNFYCTVGPMQDPSTGAEVYLWRMKAPAEYYGSIGQTTWVCKESVLGSLDHAVMIHFFNIAERELQTSEEDHVLINIRDVQGLMCTDLLQQMLAMDPTVRITPDQALKHAFFNSMELCESTPVDI